MKGMYAFRYNPLFRQWVMLGSPVAHPRQVASAHLLDTGRRDGFVAASYPRQPFIIDPIGQRLPASNGLLYAEQLPVGEYELLLYAGKTSFSSWKTTEWESWLDLVQQRIRQLHLNPHLHHVRLSLHTAALHTVEGYQRVGELIATSHPVCGALPLLDATLRQKLKASERAFLVDEEEAGCLYAASAPLHSGELWYLPETSHHAFEEADRRAKRSLSAALHKAFKAFYRLYPDSPFDLYVHTAMACPEEEGGWWVQMYRSQSEIPGFLPVTPFPEHFVKEIRNA